MPHSPDVSARRKSIRISLFAAPAIAVACATSGQSGAPMGDAGGASSSSGSGSSGSGSSGASGSSGGTGSTSSGSSSSGGSGSTSSGSSSGGSGSAPDGGLDAQAAPDGGIGGAAAAIHDDFESGGLTKWTVTDPFGNAVQSPNSVAIDTTATGGQVHGGRYAVKVQNGGAIGTTPPAANFYGRFWVWLGTNPSPGRGSGGHWAWVMGSGMLPDGAAPEVRQGGQFDILIDNYSLNDDIVLSDPNLFNDTDGGVTPPIGQWACVEFFYGKDSLRTWLQGSEITALDVTPTTVWSHAATTPPWSPAYTTIRIGYAGYNGNLITLWLDDVALDANRIGCN